MPPPPPPPPGALRGPPALPVGGYVYPPPQVFHRGGRGFFGKAALIVFAVGVVVVGALIIIAGLENRGADTSRMFCVRVATIGNSGRVINEDVVAKAPPEIREQFETLLDVMNLDNAGRMEYFQRHPERFDDAAEIEAWADDNCPA